MLVSSVVLEASDQLNDQGTPPFVRWPVAVLLTYLNDALIQVGNFRPDAFTSTVSLALVAGNQQALPVQYTLLKSIDSNGAASNCPGSPITEASLDIMRAFFKKNCQPTGGEASYRVNTFSYDAKNPNVFYVSPAVPDSAVGTDVNATVVGPAPQYVMADYTTPTNIAIDQKYRNALISWMLFKAYEVDTESQTSRQTKMDAVSMFFKTLGVDYKQESLYRSGWYLGQRGLGDPATGKH